MALMLTRVFLCHFAHICGLSAIGEDGLKLSHGSGFVDNFLPLLE